MRRIHQRYRRSVPVSARCMRSPSLMIPTSLPVSSTTGTALIRLSTSVLATSLTVEYGFTVTTGATMTSRAFMGFLSAFSHKLLQAFLTSTNRAHRRLAAAVHDWHGAAKGPIIAMPFRFALQPYQRLARSEWEENRR